MNYRPPAGNIVLVALAVLAAFVLYSGLAQSKSAAKKSDANGNTITRRCDPPKRWVEVDALADDAGRPSKVVCK